MAFDSSVHRIFSTYQTLTQQALDKVFSSLCVSVPRAMAHSFEEVKLRSRYKPGRLFSVV